MTHLKLCQLQVAWLDCMLERTRTSICRSQIASQPMAKREEEGGGGRGGGEAAECAE